MRPFRGTGLGSGCSSYLTTLVNIAVWKAHVARGFIGPERCVPETAVQTQGWRDTWTPYGQDNWTKESVHAEVSKL